MDISTEYFSREKHYFQEGQFLSNKFIINWIYNSNSIYEKSEEDKKKKEPIILSHILEQNYINKKEEVEGISIALAFHKGTNGSVNDELIEKERKKIAARFINDIQNNNEMPNVPLLLTLYQQETPNNVIPGGFIAKYYVPNGKWVNLNKQYKMLNAIDKNKYPESNDFILFKEAIQDYFPGLHLIIIGKGAYINNELTNIEIEIDSSVISYPQTIALTQYIASNLTFDSTTTVRIISFNKDIVLLKWNQSNQEIETYILK